MCEIKHKYMCFYMQADMFRIGAPPEGQHIDSDSGGTQSAQPSYRSV